MWKDNDDRIMKLFHVANKGQEKFPAHCPICGEKTGHIYIHRYDESHGGIWLWCSSCHSYTHVSGIIPGWPENLKDIDENELDGTPDYLELKATEIDNWANKLITKG